MIARAPKEKTPTVHRVLSYDEAKRLENQALKKAFAKMAAVMVGSAAVIYLPASALPRANLYYDARSTAPYCGDSDQAQHMMLFSPVVRYYKAAKQIATGVPQFPTNYPDDHCYSPESGRVVVSHKLHKLKQFTFGLRR